MGRSPVERAKPHFRRRDLHLRVREELSDHWTCLISRLDKNSANSQKCDTGATNLLRYLSREKAPA
jgi:hypothetical protein